MKETKRPRVLDKYKEAHAAKAKAEEDMAALKPEVLDVLRAGNQYSDFRFMSKSQTKVEPKEAIEWAEANLSEEEYKRLFKTEIIFDTNVFLDMVRSFPPKMRKKMPETIITQKSWDEVHVVKPKA